MELQLYFLLGLQWQRLAEFAQLVSLQFELLLALQLASVLHRFEGSDIVAAVATSSGRPALNLEIRLAEQCGLQQELTKFANLLSVDTKSPNLFQAVDTVLFQVLPVV